MTHPNTSNEQHNHGASRSRIDKEAIEGAVRTILKAIGEDPDREGLVDTPARIARMYEEIFAGMHDDVAKHLEVRFEADHDEMVLVRDISFYSLCEHHMVPFFGKAHVAYIPKDGRVTGLSKLARVVQAFARRLQLQERMTSQIADTLMEHLKPMGVAVVVEAEHLCMSMRGVRQPGHLTVTSAVRGIFRTDERTRAEAFALIRHGRS
ncbi:MAG: GTP cyclohydrolase I FolE [Limnochordales bacterium]